MNLTIRNLPGRAAEILKESAALNGRSLNAELVHLLIQAAEVEERRRYIREHWQELEEFVATLPRLPGSSVKLVREDRRR